MVSTCAALVLAVLKKPMISATAPGMLVAGLMVAVKTAGTGGGGGGGGGGTGGTAGNSGTSGKLGSPACSSAAPMSARPPLTCGRGKPRSSVVMRVATIVPSPSIAGLPEDGNRTSVRFVPPSDTPPWKPSADSIGSSGVVVVPNRSPGLVA